MSLLTSKGDEFFFKVSTLNLNGARDVRKRACLFETFKLKSLMMFQETHSDVFNETDYCRGGSLSKGSHFKPF